jgi:hypothetical protein
MLLFFCQEKVDNETNKNQSTPPTKKKRSSEIMMETPESAARKKKTPNPAIICGDHADPKNFVGNYNNGYFIPSYYIKNPNCTQKCNGTDCEVIFGKVKKISFKNPAFCCLNQIINKCNIAYCLECYNKLDSKNDSVRTRRS